VLFQVETREWRKVTSRVETETPMLFSKVIDRLSIAIFSLAIGSWPF